MPTALRIDQIRLDGGTQPRAQLNWIVIAEYADAMKEGGQFPPVTVFQDGDTYWLADGFHRVKAADQAGLDSIAADVRAGTLRDAQWYSFGANQDHGLRRNREDREKILRSIFEDPEWKDNPLTEIARHTGIPYSTVQRHFKNLSYPLGKMGKPPDRKVTRGGTTYTMNTANIGHSEPDEYDAQVDMWTEQPEGYDWTFDPDTQPGYCKYCYESHQDWEKGWDYSEPTWICKRCEHASVDRFMEAESPFEEPTGYDWTDQYEEKHVLEAAKQIRQERSQQRREERIERINEISRNNVPLESAVDRLYPVVYADPPWRYEHSQTVNREIENHYPTMSLQEICDLPVAEITTPDSILYLWTTSPKLEESMQVIDAWGYTYRTCMVWVKDRIGMGYYARQRHELLLIAKRGDFPVPDSEHRFDSVIEAPRTEHSAKPEITYEMIEAMYPDFPKIELFARHRREGWALWGNQTA